MNTAKALTILVAVAVVGIVYRLGSTGTPALPPNEQVNEITFAAIQIGMPEEQLDGLLGDPHETESGEIVIVPKTDVMELKCSIDSSPLVPGKNVLQTYLGQHDESLRVLLGEHNHLVLAAEYLIGEKPVVYKGPASDKSRGLYAIAKPLITTLNPDQEAQRRRFLTRYELVVKARRASQPDGAIVPGAGPSASEPLGPVAGLPTAMHPVDASTAVASLPAAGANKPEEGLVSVEPSPQLASDAAPTGGWFSDAVSGPNASMVTPTWAGDGDLEPLPVRIDLPTGDTLIEAMLQLPDNWQGQCFPEDVTVYVNKGPDNTVTAIATTERGKLDGTLITLNGKQRMTALAGYTQGLLSGTLRMWEDDRRRVLYSDYTRNERDGLTCLFRHGEPWLVERWKKGTLRESYLVRRDGEMYCAVARGNLAGAAADQLRRAHEQLDALLAQFAYRADKIKQSAAAEFKKALRSRLSERATGSESDMAWRGVLTSCW